MPFEEKRKLLKILYKDFTFFLGTISREDAVKSLPPDTGAQEVGHFFNKRKNEGTYVVCEGFWQEDELIKMFEKAFCNIDSIYVHQNA